jgi:hypothetical protein
MCDSKKDTPVYTELGKARLVSPVPSKSAEVEKALDTLSARVDQTRGTVEDFLERLEPILRFQDREKEKGNDAPPPPGTSPIEREILSILDRVESLHRRVAETFGRLTI